MIPIIICITLIPNGMKNKYLPIVLVYVSSEINANTPITIDKSNIPVKAPTLVLRI